ncbi:MAG: NADH-quinone oxidoreductase subunit D [Halobacteriovoraceae bacterium]|nr:NADH-quinone oxidoreductase subunit D [Halobacteriovoraceae bacterium]MBT5095685.1 NADH-quinone oxidoreductase subunit D [Halobacteriovoraceae bacterium]
MGLAFKNLARKRLLTHNEFSGHPLRKDFDGSKAQPLSESEAISFEEDGQLTPLQREKKEWVNLGPCHPATQGTLRVMLEIEGEVISRTKLEIGYLHRCFEKLCESKMYNQVIPYTDRLNYCSAPMNNIGWCKAVEDMMGIEIPDRAKALRMIFAELSRVIDHLLCIGAAAVDLGAASNFHFCFEQRERVYELFEKLCGSRLTVSLTRVGGMAFDLPIGWVNDCLKVTKIISKNIEEISTGLTRSKIWMDRTRVCPVSAKDALDWGYTGPCLRACGVNYDIRETSPYYFYGDVDFEIPLGINGDCYDRYLVRVEEMRQSLKIVAQVLDNLPSGDVRVSDPNISLPNKKNLHSNFESMSQHLNIITNGVVPARGEIYSSTEVANGELGFYVISDGSKNPYRVKVRPPCFSIFQSFPDVVKNSMVSDAMATLGSMNVIAGELDR